MSKRCNGNAFVAFPLRRLWRTGWSDEFTSDEYSSSWWRGKKKTQTDNKVEHIKQPVSISNKHFHRKKPTDFGTRFYGAYVRQKICQKLYVIAAIVCLVVHSRLCLSLFSVKPVVEESWDTPWTVHLETRAASTPNKSKITFLLNKFQLFCAGWITIWIESQKKQDKYCNLPSFNKYYLSACSTGSWPAGGISRVTEQKVEVKFHCNKRWLCRNWGFIARGTL